jgi:hypothetical protein
VLQDSTILTKASQLADCEDSSALQGR